MILLAQLALGLILSALIGFVAYRRGSLTRSGVVGAILVGTAIFGFGGLAWGLTLITFFVTSSLLSHYKESVKEKLAEKFDKGHQRDLGQTLANGGVGALVALAWILPMPSAVFLDIGHIHLFINETRSLLMAAFVGALATVNADTWATELGVLSKEPPRLITSLKVVEVGTSGGVSLRGTLAALGGAFLISIAFPTFQNLECEISHELSGGVELVNSCKVTLLFIPVAAFAGLAGSLFDSLLGTTVQAIYYCPTCRKETERTLHTCGTPTTLTRGWRWLNNDMVNFVSSLVGAGIAAGLWALFVRV